MDDINANSLGEALRRELDLVRDTRNSQPTKYDRIKCIFLNRSRVSVAACHISNISREWTPRVGQAVMSLPQGLIILSAESLTKRTKGGKTYGEKLTRLIEYIGRLDFAMAFIGEERRWKAELIVGVSGSDVRRALEEGFPEAERITI
jgi:hypothetical protein